MKIRKAYDKHPRFQFSTTGISLTHQSMAPECDVNSIMRKYEKTGILEHRNTFEGKYGDFTDAPMDYHAAANSVLAADEMFQSLPARVRRRFHNDPGAFVDFVGNPENASELVSMGLASAPPAEVIEAPEAPLEPPTPPS